jgi:glycerol-3-phosphate acyltransferase PlsX
VIWIAVDALGGDLAPGPIVAGAVAAARHFDLGVVLVGPRDRIAAELARVHHDPDRVRLVEASDVIGMAEAPAAALKRKSRASIRVAADVVARGEAAALFSAGHTGATVMAAHAAFGMIDGVDRPALAAALPTRKRPSVLLDVGATVECRPAHLLQFAAMGSVYARVSFGISTPRVGLLSIGEEESKGNELTREAHQLLKAADARGEGWDFVGNIEARDVYSGDADVIVCDGFTGNIALKVSEGLIETASDVIARELGHAAGGRPSRRPASAGRTLGVARALRRFRSRMDYAEYGGAPLLGVAGIAIVGHGRSSARAVRNAVAMAHRFAGSAFIERVAREIALSTVPHQ